MKKFIAIDLKSFYASVECIERGLDPLNANLVVADESRTDKTICLAVSPALKSFGIPGRPRLFEVRQAVSEINTLRLAKAPHGKFDGSSVFRDELENDKSKKLGFVTAKPQMAKYMDISSKIFSIYMSYVSEADIHIYSVDEVFMDVTGYLKTYKMTAHELAIKMIRDVLSQTGITATAGIGTNMYLAKIAMDIVAKKMPADKDGVRIAELDEQSYRRLLWEHKPLTDFWRIGGGYDAKLRKNGMFTMGDVARMSIENENLLYRLFGINAELLIDHAWGYEPCEISDIKNYTPENNSLSSGQVLSSPYDFDKARVIVTEMADKLSLDLVGKKLVCDQIVLHISYDGSSLENPDLYKSYTGKVELDRYGRAVPKSAHGSENLGRFTASTKLIVGGMLDIYEKITDKNLLVRRVTVIANHVMPEHLAKKNDGMRQMSLFDDAEAEKQTEEELSDEKNLQLALLDIKRRFGKNAILKGTNFVEGSTAIERNGQVGGHKA